MFIIMSDCFVASSSQRHQFTSSREAQRRSDLVFFILCHQSEADHKIRFFIFINEIASSACGFLAKTDFFPLSHTNHPVLRYELYKERRTFRALMQAEQGRLTRDEQKRTLIVRVASERELTQ